jgi:hypothetical protein
MSNKLRDAVALGATLLGMALLVAPPAALAQEEAKPRAAIDLRHSTNGFIVLCDGPGEAARPLFNMMIPEYIKTGDRDAVPEDKKPRRSCFFHVQPSEWKKLAGDRWRMSQDYPGYLGFEVVLTPAPDALYLAWRIRNNNPKEALEDVSGDFCCGCKDFLTASLAPEASLPRWEKLVFRQASVYSPGKKWRPYPQGGDSDALILACRSLDGERLIAHASDRIGNGSHAFANTCIHHSARVAKQIAPGQWSPWQRRAVYLLRGTQDDLLARYEQDFQGGENASKYWPE